LHGVVEIDFVVVKIVYFYLIAFLFTGTNEQKVKSKQTKYQRNENIVKNDFLHKDVHKHGIKQHHYQKEQHAKSLQYPKRKA